MDELIGAILAPFAAIFFLVFAVILMPFVLLGQLVYDLTRPKGERRGLSWERKSVFRHYTDGLWEGVIVYGVASLAVLAIFAGTAVSISLKEDPPAAVQTEDKDGLLKKVVTAGGKAALAEADERGWLDRFRADEEEAAASERAPTEETNAEKRPFWKFWE